MTPEYKKELALAEAKKYFFTAKERVVVVMPFEAAWLDPSDEAMDAINDFASERLGSVHVFAVPVIEDTKKLKKGE